MEDNEVTRYNFFINIAKLFQLIEVFVAVVLVSWSSSRLPSVLKLSGEHLFAFSSNLLNQHVVFFVGNVIIFVCYVLSRHNKARNDSEIHNEKYSLSSEPKVIGETSIEEVGPPVKETEPVKETAIVENRNDEVCYEKAIVKTESGVAVEMVIKQAAKQIEWFSRTQSAKLKSELSLRPQREMRRSATATATRSNMLVTSFNGSSPAISIETVDKLSNEEFQVIVETFIKASKQSMAENGVKL